MKIRPYLLLLLLPCCRDNSTSSLAVLQKAGPNRPELEKVISYYSQKKEDSLKLKAANFLISNMEGKFSLKGDSLDTFLRFCDSISLSFTTQSAYKRAFVTYYMAHGSLIGQPSKVDDIILIHADYLINNIEEAFSSWNNAPWKTKVKFETFCEYILPYRIGNEPYESFRTSLYSKYKFDDLDKCSEQMAADSILSRTIDPGMFLYQFPDHVSSMPVSILQHLKGGNCIESSSLSIYIMRSFGLPIAQDFTPQWPHRAGGHVWSALVINEDSCIDFEGVNAGKVGGHLLINTGNKIAKVYRKMFSRQPRSLAMLHYKEEIPEVFNDPCLKDVSACYYKGVDFPVKYDKTLSGQSKFVYLCVFDNQNWVPVSWAEANNGTAIFTGMGKNIMYLPAAYKEGDIKPIGPPLEVDSTGTVHMIVPQKENTQTLHLKRKYPVFDWWDSRTLALIGGRFQAANKADFRDAVDLYTITQPPEMNYQSIEVNPYASFRYWRYLPRDSTYGDIAELAFYDQHNQKVSGYPIGSKESDPDNAIQAAFDGNPLTFFQGLRSVGNWVGVRFDSPKQLSKIKFLCRNDDNFINQSDIYELFYWDAGQWQSLGTRTGDSTQALIFPNAPAGALYLLHDRTRGKEERIFTYENDRQSWW